MGKWDFEQLTGDQRKSIFKTIQPINTDELKKIGQEIFPWVDDAWRDAFFGFIDENRGSSFYHALTSDNLHIIYCRDKDKGMWHLPGSGKGPLQSHGRQVMKEAIEARR